MSLLSILVCERHSSCWFIVIFLVNSQFCRSGIFARVFVAVDSFEKIIARLAGGCIFRSPCGKTAKCCPEISERSPQTFRVPHTREHERQPHILQSCRALNVSCGGKTTVHGERGGVQQMVRALHLQTHTHYQTFLLSPSAADARTKCVRSTEAYHSIIAAHPEL